VEVGFIKAARGKRCVPKFHKVILEPSAATRQQILLRPKPKHAGKDTMQLPEQVSVPRVEVGFIKAARGKRRVPKFHKVILEPSAAMRQQILLRPKPKHAGKDTMQLPEQVSVHWRCLAISSRVV